MVQCLVARARQLNITYFLDEDSSRSTPNVTRSLARHRVSLLLPCMALWAEEGPTTRVIIMFKQSITSKDTLFSSITSRKKKIALALGGESPDLGVTARRLDRQSCSLAYET